MSDLNAIVDDVDQRHSAAIDRKAADGSIRALELQWVALLTEEQGFHVVPAFTAKQRANLKDLVLRLGAAETKELIEYSVKNWQRIYAQVSYLPPRPVFDTLYFHRDKFLAYMVEDKERTKKVTENTQKMKQYEIFHKREEETAPKTVGQSLSEMVRAERLKMQRERKEKHG